MPLVYANMPKSGCTTIVACDFEAPRMNEGPPAPFPYQEVLDDEIRAAGRRLFADHLRNFGYVV